MAFSTLLETGCTRSSSRYTTDAIVRWVVTRLRTLDVAVEVEVEVEGELRREAEEEQLSLVIVFGGWVG